jgi:hypothetical protein
MGLLVGGIATGMCGIALMIYCYAFASMVDPRLSLSGRVTTIIGKMLLSPLVVVVALSGVLVCAGIGICMLAFSLRARTLFTWRPSIVVSVITGLVLLGSMVAVLMLL